MTISVSIQNSHDHTFNCVEALTFHSGAANITGLPVAEWTHYQEEGHGSEQLVNVDLSLVALDSIAYIDGILCAFVRHIK
jgi:hypothetical protein